MSMFDGPNCFIFHLKLHMEKWCQGMWEKWHCKYLFRTQCKHKTSRQMTQTYTRGVRTNHKSFRPPKYEQLNRILVHLRHNDKLMHAVIYTFSNPVHHRIMKWSSVVFMVKTPILSSGVTHDNATTNKHTNKQTNKQTHTRTRTYSNSHFTNDFHLVEKVCIGCICDDFLSTCW